MTTAKIYTLEPLEPITNVEQRLEKQINDLSSFNFSIDFLKDLINYFKEENCKSKKKYES